ncbi:hypothetical protein KOR42_32090 [Thalassoglobus neptunius]|uniref:Uncharacterized protein n=1 Tax=Thalassoglobus neptunius TaxID=1938619 RepID=A0A5C5WMT1_9PLAN|nr:hypothetical protein KOR42_32090 [Thalassoglobus neptunius]
MPRKPIPMTTIHQSFFASDGPKNTFVGRNAPPVLGRSTVEAVRMAKAMHLTTEVSGRIDSPRVIG